MAARKAARKPAAQAEPVPVKTDSRICFGIAWFASEEEANRYSQIVHKRGDTYNGGWYHGMACGRDRGFDYKDEQHGQLYAVTTR